jgi:Hemopexin
VDAAVNWGNGTAFFFKRPQYLKYDIGHDRVASVVPPYPLDIAPDQWPALVPVGFTSGIGTALEWPYAEIASINVPANRSGCTETFFSATSRSI